MSAKPTTKDSEMLDYILMILTHAGPIKPDYHAAAKAGGVCNANVAQTKFRKFVEAAGYNLVNGTVVNRDSNEAKAAAAAPMKGGRPKKEAGATLRTKKRKRDVSENGEAEEDDGVKDEAGVGHH